MNRLKTTGPVLGIDTLSRSQLILLLQCGYDFGTVLTQGEYQCRLEVYHDGEKRTLVFFRAGEDSLAGARYVNITSIVAKGSVSDCGYAELYGEDGFYMRFRVVDSVGKKTKRSRTKFQLATGRMPDFRLSIANCALKDLVEATGRYPLYAPRSRGSFEIEISDNDGTRQVEFIRDGSTLEKFDLVSAVPVCEFGEYTKFIIYGNMGRTVALKVLPYSFNRIAEKKKRE